MDFIILNLVKQSGVALLKKHVFKDKIAKIRALLYNKSMR